MTISQLINDNQLMMRMSNATIKFVRFRTHYFLLVSMLFSCLIISCTSGNSSGNADHKNVGVLNNPSQKIDFSLDAEIVKLTENLDANPEDPVAMYDLGQKYLDLGDPALARDFFVKAINLDPANASFKIAHANSFADQGKVDEAEKIFEAVLLEDDQNTDAFVSWGVMYYNLGLVYKDKERMDIARKKFEKALEIDPKNIKALFNLGLLYSAKKEFKMAGKYFLDVHQLEPERATAIQHLANISLELNDLDACREYSEKGLKIKENAELIYFLGRVAHENKEYPRAKELLKKFLELNYIGRWEADARARLLEIDGIDSGI